MWILSLNERIIPKILHITTSVKNLIKIRQQITAGVVFCYPYYLVTADDWRKITKISHHIIIKLNHLHMYVQQSVQQDSPIINTSTGSQHVTVYCFYPYMLQYIVHVNNDRAEIMHQNLLIASSAHMIICNCCF